MLGILLTFDFHFITQLIDEPNTLFHPPASLQRKRQSTHRHAHPQHHQRKTVM